MLNMTSIKDFNKYKQELKKSVIRSKAEVLDFRAFEKFPFSTGKGVLLLVGKIPPPLLKEVIEVVKKTQSGRKVPC